MRSKPVGLLLLLPSTPDLRSYESQDPLRHYVSRRQSPTPSLSSPDDEVLSSVSEPLDHRSAKTAGSDSVKGA